MVDSVNNDPDMKSSRSKVTGFGVVAGTFLIAYFVVAPLISHVILRDYHHMVDGIHQHSLSSETWSASTHREVIEAELRSAIKLGSGTITEWEKQLFDDLPSAQFHKYNKTLSDWKGAELIFWTVTSPVSRLLFALFCAGLIRETIYGSWF